MKIEQLLLDPKTPTSRKRQHILEELIQMYKAARKSGQISSALKVIELLAKELGFLQCLKTQVQLLSLTELSHEELLSLLESNQTQR